MEKKEASQLYNDIIGENVMRSYKDAEEMIIYNDNDPDMKAIPVYLPKPPDWKFIDGFGRMAKDQKWERPIMPKKLRDIVYEKVKRLSKDKDKGDYYTIDEIWDILENKQEEFIYEINWIKRMWYYRIYGYWFFNNGVPTYITGKHFYYLSGFHIDVGFPKYRSRDRKYWIFVEFCHNDTWDFVNKSTERDNEGMAVPEDGVYKMYNTGRRICYGDVYPKMRREGATYRAIANNLETISKAIESNGGIQSRNKEDAAKVFRKLMKGYKRVPFFWKPSTTSKSGAVSALEFDRASQSSDSAVLNIGLQSRIDFESGDEGAYDGDKLLFKHDDEEGKNKDYNVVKKNLISKECLSTGFGRSITGYSSKTSTAGEMEGGGGENFHILCMQSDFYKRGINGQTLSGFYLLFIPSEDGVVIDQYGNSIIEDPKDPIVSEDGSLITIGGRSWIENSRSMYLSQGDIEGWQEKCRQYPQKLSEAFITSTNSIGFNMHILETRLNELRFTDKYWVFGDLIRLEQGNRFSRIKFIENPNGRFKLSKVLSDTESNKFFRRDGYWYPQNTTKYNGGADPFKFNQTEGGQMSDGGFAIKYKRDFNVDPQDRPIDQWESDRFVLSYLFRPATKEEFADDVLKGCLYFGCQVLAETNVSLIIDKFTEWGAYPFLKFMKDINGNWRKTPGMHSGEFSKDEIFSTMRDYIERRGRWERHRDILMQCKNIPSIKKMTKYDLFTAAGLAEISEKVEYTMMKKEDQDEYTDISEIIETYV